MFPLHSTLTIITNLRTDLFPMHSLVIVHLIKAINVLSPMVECISLRMSLSMKLFFRFMEFTLPLLLYLLLHNQLFLFYFLLIHLFLLQFHLYVSFSMLFPLTVHLFHLFFFFSTNPILHSRPKHMELDLYLVREKVMAK